MTPHEKLRAYLCLPTLPVTYIGSRSLSNAWECTLVKPTKGNKVNANLQIQFQTWQPESKNKYKGSHPLGRIFKSWGSDLFE